ncbi:DUF4372 domain-containing protein [Prevotella ihumii]|uniref:DUF4372 domain-containing protein n=1 Tax=Prevotella ihumii TaxID=1917878 RepID=UPI0009824F99
MLRQNKNHYQIIGKGTHFLGQPILNQLLNYFNKQNILQISRDMGGERYVKSFNPNRSLITLKGVKNGLLAKK